MSIMNNDDRILFLDDGHGLETLGKRTPVMPCGVASGRSIHENEFNRAVVDKVAEMAKLKGYEIVLVANGDLDLPLRERTNMANKCYLNRSLTRDSSVYISIHANAYDGEFGTNNGGVETYFCPGSEDGKWLANCIQSELLKGTAQIDRGIKSENFYVLRETLMPAVLIEALFMDVLDEALLMLDENFQNEVAHEIMNGVDKYFGVTVVDDSIKELKEQVANLETQVSQLRNLFVEGLKIIGGENEDVVD